MTTLYAKVHLCHKGSIILKGSHLPVDVEPEFLSRWREENAIAEVPVVNFAIPPEAEEKSIPTAPVEFTLPLPEDAPASPVEVTAIGIAEPVSSVVANEEAFTAGILPVVPTAAVAAPVESETTPETETEQPAAGGADPSPAPTSPPPPASDAGEQEQPKPTTGEPKSMTGQRPPRGGRGR